MIFYTRIYYKYTWIKENKEKEMNDKIIIGCDIGGVIKDRQTDQPIEGSIETLKEILSNEPRGVFWKGLIDISKIESPKQSGFLTP